MDMSRYMQLFVAECREMLQSLNLSIVQLESNSSDAGTIDEVFRHAHSLKGVSSTMGFDSMAALTHEMEHIFEVIRTSQRQVSRQVIDLVLECVDLLETAVDNIDESGDENIDIGGLIARLQALDASAHDASGDLQRGVPSGGGEKIVEVGPVAAGPSADIAGNSGLPADLTGVHIKVKLVDDCQSASIRAFMVFTMVERFGTLLWSSPDVDDVDDFDGRIIELVISPELALDENELDETISRIAEVERVTLVSLEGATRLEVEQAVPRAASGLVTPTVTETPRAATAPLTVTLVATAADSAPNPRPTDVDGLNILVTLATECESPSIRAFMVCSALGGVGHIAWSLPDLEDLDDFDGRAIELLFEPGQGIDADAVAALLDRVAEVSSVDIAPVAAAGVVATDTSAVSPPAVDPAASAVPASVPLALAASNDLAAVAAANERAAAVAAAAAETDRTSELPEGVPVERRKTPKRRLSGTVRVDAARLDKLMHLMGEVVVHRTNVEAQLKRGDLRKASEAVQELRRSTQSLQAEVMNVRMVPVETVFMRMPRLVRDLSTRLGKDVDLQIVGADTEIDRSVVDALSDPLVHMVRNAVDHGLETPAVRRAAGKAEKATLRISAGHSGGNVMIAVEDDGAGVNLDVVRSRAVERGLITAEQAAVLDEEAVIELLFLPGFSTAETTTEISGRGVGMDAVRNMTRELGGDISIVSKVGEGTIARLAIPLTLAVMTVLVVDVDGIRLALPIDRVERTVRLSDHPITESGALRLMAVDDGTHECIDLGGYVGYGVTRESRYGVIVQGRSGRKVLSVSNLIGEYETVTRPLPRVSGDRAVFMGGSVQSDGTVVLIVNVDGIFEGDVGRSGGYNQFALV